MLGFVLLEELDERNDALFGHGVVDGGAQTANGLMALQVIEARCLGGGDDVGVLLLGGSDEGNVHKGAELGLYGSLEELGLIEEIIQDLGLVLVHLGHGLKTADALQILEDLTAYVDGPAVGGVVEGVVGGMSLIAHVGGHPGGKLRGIADEILTHDDDYHARGADVLLNAAVDHAVIGYVAGLGEEHGALVGNKDLALGVGELLIGGAVDGLILADIDVIGVLADGQIGAIGDIAVVAVLAGCDKVDLAVLLRLGIGLLGPVAGDDVIGNAVLHEVHGDHGELEGRAALDEHYLVVIGDVHEVAKILLGLVNDLLEDLGTVAHLHDAHAGAFIIHEVVTNALKHLLGEDGGTCGEVVNTIVCHDCTPLSCPVAGIFFYLHYNTNKSAINRFFNKNKIYLFSAVPLPAPPPGLRSPARRALLLPGGAPETPPNKIWQIC